MQLIGQQRNKRRGADCVLVNSDRDVCSAVLYLLYEGMLQMVAVAVCWLLVARKQWQSLFSAPVFQSLLKQTFLIGKQRDFRDLKLSC